MRIFGRLRKLRTAFTRLKYLPAALLCWYLRRRGYAVMLYHDHFGHQAGDVEYDLRTKDKKLLYLAGIVPNKALRRMHERVAKVVDISPRLRRYLTKAETVNKCLDEPLSRDLKIYSDSRVWKRPPALEFSENERVYGELALRDLGLTGGGYVCFHARDSKYGRDHHPAMFKERGMKETLTEDHKCQSLRNVDFATYFKAIDWLASRGVKAVRLGSDVEKSFKHPNLVDYASLRHLAYDGDLLDLYLMANCFLYVGHGTGVTHISAIFNTPAVCLNYFPYTPKSRGTPNVVLCRAKRIKWRGKEYNEIDSRHLFDGMAWWQIYQLCNEMEVIDNTPDEILEAVKYGFDAQAGKADWHHRSGFRDRLCG